MRLLLSTNNGACSTCSRLLHRQDARNPRDYDPLMMPHLIDDTVPRTRYKSAAVCRRAGRSCHTAMRCAECDMPSRYLRTPIDMGQGRGQLSSRPASSSCLRATVCVARSPTGQGLPDRRLLSLQHGSDLLRRSRPQFNCTSADRHPGPEAAQKFVSYDLRRHRVARRVTSYVRGCNSISYIYPAVNRDMRCLASPIQAQTTRWPGCMRRWRPYYTQRLPKGRQVVKPRTRVPDSLSEVPAAVRQIQDLGSG